MLTQLPKTARDVLATAVYDADGCRLLEIGILRLLEGGAEFALADELAVPFHGGVIHSHQYSFLLSHEAYVGFPTESDECFLADVNNNQWIGVRRGESVRSFRVHLTDHEIERTWRYDVPVLPLLMLIERLLRRDAYYALAAIVTLIRRHDLDETFTEQLNTAFHAPYLDCLNEVRQVAAHERD